VVLKDLGYATGQFGKNHLGDRDEHLPTNHGFDEFLGNLYHLNAEEEPENEDYPASPEFRKKYGPRGVIHSYSDGRIEDTGPLTKKRMETVDDETAAAALDFIDRQHAAGKPWFVWWSGTRMHFRTHVSDERMAECKAKYPRADEYQCGMVEHDMHIGMFLDKLDELGITDNTVVFYSAVKRTPTGKAAGAFRPSSAGPARFRKGESPTRSCTTWTGCRPSPPWPARTTSRKT